jgi:hypothetical protein
MTRFDHIEAHVGDIKKYCEHLTKIFRGGKVEVLNKEGVAMFTSPDGLNIEVKNRTTDESPVLSGFCSPCLRMEGARSFILDTLGYRIVDKRRTPQGYPVYFFRDYEGVLWHIKDIPESVGGKRGA